MIEDILRYNREFVERKEYTRYETSKYPDKKIAIVTCMDTRLVELLPAALGIRNGDVKMIKNAGGSITNPFDSTMRSLLVAVYELGVNEIMIIGHTGCGVQGMNAGEMLNLMRKRGISEEHITLMRHCGIDLDKWLHGFEDTADAVRETVDLVRNHPLMAADVRVAGYIMDSLTGALQPLPVSLEPSRWPHLQPDSLHSQRFAPEQNGLRDLQSRGRDCRSRPAEAETAEAGLPKPPAEAGLPKPRLPKPACRSAEPFSSKAKPLPVVRHSSSLPLTSI